MARMKMNELSTYVTPGGRKLISISVTTELEAKILSAANKKSLSRQAYIITAINEALERDEGKEVANGKGT